MKKNLTVSQRIQAAVGSSEIESVMATHAYLHAPSRSAEEWTTVWSTADDTSWAHSFGRMRGFQSVWMGSVGDYDAKVYASYIELYQRFPEITGRDPRPIYINSLHTLTNPVIEMSEDGQTGRVSYLTPGLLYDTFNETGTRWGQMLWERYGADFRLEDGKWLYIHDQVCPDWGAPFDNANHAFLEYDRLKNPDKYPPRGDTRPVNLEDDVILHHYYTSIQTVQDTVPCPEPYKKLDNNNTYTQWPQYDD